LVHGAIKERQRYRPQQQSIIDKLIEEALLEFTSLTDEKNAQGGSVKPVAGFSLGSGSWIDEISVTGRIPDQLHPSLPLSLTAGNLAALEDEEIAPRAPVRPSHSVAGSHLVAAAPRAPVFSPSVPAPSVAPPDKRASVATKVGVAVALLVVVAAGAAAWFTHLIPHP
jgi:hypothetical protein